MVKQVQTVVTRWQAFDGSLFGSESDAIDYEKRLSGIRRVCPVCDGAKQLEKVVDDEPVLEDCGECLGRGYQEKAEVWK